MSTSRGTPHQKSSCWPSAPGVYVNVEFKVSMSENDRGHGASLRYTSRNMKERERARANTHLGGRPIPSILTPGYPQPNHPSRQQQRPQQQQERDRGLSIGLETPERGRSAPPTMNDRRQPVSPVSPVSPMSAIDSPIQQRIVNLPRQNIMDRLDQPLPSTPGRFRLGEDDLPWSTPPSYWNAKPDTSESVGPIRLSIEPYHPPQAPQVPPNTTPTKRNEDPQRVRELSELQQAMMTVDSISNDVWDSWMWESVGEMPRGPRSIGWAVSSNDAPDSPSSPTPETPPPPPYVVSQWEHACGRRIANGRPRSTG
ncbi:f55ac787-b668-4f2b-a643-c77161c08826-CDS [Sclerotinia trifoliorum]|uniref:F55ac787-b668-4f2b-a643-c77161c08826-CDS n=1 Tax=Sclerotinia trifoliorum TaxID=28548 RepID=A0A8H2W5M6_9HELO|nr:f55ac787-b668-4f2b-a643-c77161c08826-CDS [Sclerotinia trifoliorum]